MEEETTAACRCLDDTQCKTKVGESVVQSPIVFAGDTPKSTTAALATVAQTERPLYYCYVGHEQGGVRELDPPRVSGAGNAAHSNIATGKANFTLMTRVRKYSQHAHYSRRKLCLCSPCRCRMRMMRRPWHRGWPPPWLWRRWRHRGLSPWLSWWQTSSRTGCVQPQMRKDSPLRPARETGHGKRKTSTWCVIIVSLPPLRAYLQLKVYNDHRSNTRAA